VAVHSGVQGNGKRPDYDRRSHGFIGRGRVIEKRARVKDSVRTVQPSGPVSCRVFGKSIRG
jgi:hypothetical protein